MAVKVVQHGHRGPCVGRKLDVRILGTCPLLVRVIKYFIKLNLAVSTLLNIKLKNPFLQNNVVKE